MEFLKKHYEKIVLSLALLALAATAIWVFLAIQQKQEEVQVSLAQTGKPKPFPPVDLAPYKAALENARKAVSVDLSGSHVLFNPAMWKQKADGTLIKMQSSNPADALAITKVSPLHLVINYERQAGTGFYFGITKEAAARPAERRKVQRYVNEGGKADLFTLKKVEGSAETPERFTLELNESKQEVVITPTQPFQRLEGYAADLNYNLENKTFNDQRVGNVITFGGESYKIIAITENEVRVQANSNQKQTTIRWKPAP
ncbi:MAG: hypothetical protein H0X66_09195 [Verrucomicrobia bacterium]|nr:hypothetical protein [Verrucomicrobiota bacterium]